MYARHIPFNNCLMLCRPFKKERIIVNRHHQEQNTHHARKKTHECKQFYLKCAHRLNRKYISIDFTVFYCTVLGIDGERE